MNSSRSRPRFIVRLLMAVMAVVGLLGAIPGVLERRARRLLGLASSNSLEAAARGIDSFYLFMSRYFN